MFQRDHSSSSVHVEAGFRIEKTTPSTATMGLVIKVGNFPETQLESATMIFPNKDP